MQNTRDNTIDILRFIGLMLIFLSHASPSVDSIVQLRSFDVPMMLFISGLTCSNKEFPNYFNFIKKRTLRLVVPVYIFLCIYLPFIAIIQHYDMIPQYLTTKIVIESFLLLNGIGYVWIIRVFLLIMLITPLLCKLGKQSNSIVLTAMTLMLSLSELLVHITNKYEIPAFVNIIVKDYIVYLLAYSAPFLLGYKIRNNNKGSYTFWSIVCSTAFIVGICIYIHNWGLPICISPKYKYPPQPYFIIYGLFCSTVLWTTRSLWSKYLNYNLIQFIGQNTIWIYLWHIPFVLFFRKFIDDWCIRYLLLLGFSISLYAIKYKIVKKIRMHKELKNYFRG